MKDHFYADVQERSNLPLTLSCQTEYVSLIRRSVGPNRPSSPSHPHPHPVCRMSPPRQPLAKPHSASIYKVRASLWFPVDLSLFVFLSHFLMHMHLHVNVPTDTQTHTHTHTHLCGCIMNRCNDDEISSYYHIKRHVKCAISHLRRKQ